MLSSANNHIIQKQSIEINFDQLEDAMGIQHQLADIYYEKLQPAMLALFDEMVDEKHLITIDRLEIDCGRLLSKDWKEDWVAATIRNLKEQLNAASKKQVSQPEDEGNGFLFFLATGLLSWNNRAVSVAAMEDIPLTVGWLEKLKKLLRDESRAADRLANSCSRNFVNKLLKTLLNQYKTGGNTDEIQSMLNYYQQNAKADGALLLRAFSGETITGLKEKFDAIAQNKAQNDRPANEQPSQKKQARDLPFVFVGNAGLVLVNPFLPVLFERLELWQDKQWKNKTAQHKAILLLEFLATGLDAAPEFNLPLNKILCGMEVNDVWEAPAPLSEAEKNECAGLLDQLISNWPKLKNTSRQALREIFLQRKGKLEITGELWKLKVEQKAFDVLLNTLPWGIGVIKLPWMQRMLHTEWAN